MKLFLPFFSFLFLFNIQMTPVSPKIYSPILHQIQSAISGFENISEERKIKLRQLAGYIQKNKDQKDTSHLVFICTHNSRRSHFSQIWAAVAAHYYQLDDWVKTYSGGTEATAFNPRAVSSLERFGFVIKNPGGENPKYQVTFAEEGPVLICYSKVYHAPENQHQPMTAVMTCSQADAACPLVRGATHKVSLPFDDPKAFDNTPLESEKYDERSRQIASEILYVMSLIH